MTIIEALRELKSKPRLRMWAADNKILIVIYSEGFYLVVDRIDWGILTAPRRVAFNAGQILEDNWRVTTEKERQAFFRQKKALKFIPESNNDVAA